MIIWGSHKFPNHISRWKDNLTGSHSGALYKSRRPTNRCQFICMAIFNQKETITLEFTSSMKLVISLYSCSFVSNDDYTPRCSTHLHSTPLLLSSGQTDGVTMGTGHDHYVLCISHILCPLCRPWGISVIRSSLFILLQATKIRTYTLGIVNQWEVRGWNKTLAQLGIPFCVPIPTLFWQWSRDTAWWIDGFGQQLEMLLNIEIIVEDLTEFFYSRRCRCPLSILIMIDRNLTAINLDL